MQGQNLMRETAVVEKAQKKNNTPFRRTDMQDIPLMCREKKFFRPAKRKVQSGQAFSRVEMRLRGNARL